MKGKWVGGPTPLGYDVDREKKRLVPNLEEKKVVREIFELYLKYRSLLQVVQELNRRGFRTKKRPLKNGQFQGGGPYGITTLQILLSNPLYMGKVLCAGKLYPGEHEAIISEDLFLAVEAARKANCQQRSGVTRKAGAVLLKGLLRCKACDSAMKHTYTQKRGLRYRYYTCIKAQKRGHDTCPEPSLHAQGLEEAAIDCLKRIVADPQAVPHPQVRDFFDSTWQSLFPVEQCRIFHLLLEEVEYDAETRALNLTLSGVGMRRFQEEIAPAAERIPA